MKQVEGVMGQKQATLAATIAELQSRNETLMELAQVCMGGRCGELVNACCASFQVVAVCGQSRMAQGQVLAVCSQLYTTVDA